MLTVDCGSLAKAKVKESLPPASVVSNNVVLVASNAGVGSGPLHANNKLLQLSSRATRLPRDNN
jgi:hypothetical protein